MLDLDEAIIHCKEKAKELRRKAIVDYENDKTTLAEFADCRECAAEHEQLAEWLSELKELRGSKSQGEYLDISKLRLMTVEECAGHTIEYAMGWKACIEWIKKVVRNETDN